MTGALLSSRIAIATGLVFLGLAYAVARASRAAAVAVVALYVLNTVVAILLLGFRSVSPVWTVILGAMLWAGMRGVFAQANRRTGERMDAG